MHIGISCALALSVAERSCCLRGHVPLAPGRALPPAVPSLPGGGTGSIGLGSWLLTCPHPHGALTAVSCRANGSTSSVNTGFEVSLIT